MNLFGSKTGKKICIVSDFLALKNRILPKLSPVQKNRNFLPIPHEQKKTFLINTDLH